MAAATEPTRSGPPASRGEWACGGQSDLGGHAAEPATGPGIDIHITAADLTAGNDDLAAATDDQPTPMSRGNRGRTTPLPETRCRDCTP